jgi:hypothetical protein
VAGWRCMSRDARPSVSNMATRSSARCRLVDERLA